MPDQPDNPWPTGRRIKAAMRLAGIESFEELAAKIDKRNYGSRTLRKYADDNDLENVAHRGQLVVIAEACELPYEFFTADYSTLARESAIDAAIEDRLERIVSELRAEQIERANLEQALQELLGADLRSALAAARAQ